MKAIAVLAIALVALSCRDARPPSGPIGPVSTRGDDRAPAEMESYIVQLKRDAGPASAFAKAHGVSPKFVYLRALNGFAAALGAAAASGLAHDPDVVSVTPVHVMHAVQEARPSKPFAKPVSNSGTGDPCQTSAPFHLDRIDQPRDHLDGKYCYWPSAGSGVNAYIIDSGIRSTHVDFLGRVGVGTDFVGDGNGVEDCLGHGTHVSGILGGTTYGVAKLVTIHPIRVFGCSGTTTDATVIAAIDWVIANGVRPAVVNMSLEGSHSDVDDAAVESMVAAGFVVTVAAGNDVGDACNFSPGSAPDAITVGGTQGNLGKYGLTNTGPCVDLFAPAEASSDWFTSDNATFFQQGTSMSAPGAGGAAALYLGEHATASPAAVASYLLLTATAGAITGLPAGTANLFLRTHNGAP